MDLFLGVISFTGIVTILVLVILFARSQLVSSGNVSIIINDDDSNKLVVKSGAKLLQTLAENKIFLSSACGVVAELVVNVNVELVKVEALFYQLKNLILIQGRKKMVGDYHVKLLLRMI